MTKNTCLSAELHNWDVFSACVLQYCLLALSASHYVALLSSPLNPLLYYFSSVEFNVMMRQMLGAMCCRAVSLSSGYSTGSQDAL